MMHNNAPFESGLAGSFLQWACDGAMEGRARESDAFGWLAETTHA